MPRHSTPSETRFEPFAAIDDDSETSTPARVNGEVALHIERRIRERLGARVRELQVVREGDRIELRGRCHTYHTKQLAQHAAQAVIDDEVLDNAIVVELG